MYYRLGGYAQAEPLFRRALRIREKALGSNHLDTAQSLNGLTLLTADMGNYVEAERLYLRTLSIREKALEPDDPEKSQQFGPPIRCHGGVRQSGAALPTGLEH